MKTIDLSIKIGYCQMEELPADEQQLVEAAVRATKNSYSPYSHFAVGAALRLENGTVVTGANQENAAYPSGLCAERTAIFSAQAQYPDQPVTALAIAARNGGSLVKSPIVPCGACRQVAVEIEDRYKHPIRVFLYGTDGIYVVDTIKDLLPLYFVGDAMK
ncbi:cytidine deaminase [Prevotella dentasini]|uniref:cytidine deaminase n=1 Tax=Prevotella dentasini TaxID=589537 RepID=UPI000469F919|nr:cytidine deaminase [Prevotella dentasini]